MGTRRFDSGTLKPGLASNISRTLRASQKTAWHRGDRGKSEAADALVVHTALKEQAPLVIFFLNLAVGVIDAFFQPAGNVGVKIRLAGLVVGCDRRGAASDTGTSIELVGERAMLFQCVVCPVSARRTTRTCLRT